MDLGATVVSVEVYLAYRWYHGSGCEDHLGLFTSLEAAKAACEADAEHRGLGWADTHDGREWLYDRDGPTSHDTLTRHTRSEAYSIAPMEVEA